MSDAIYETQRRMIISENIREKFEGCSIGSLVVGSVAYSAYNKVNHNSDLDVLVIVDNLKDIIDIATSNPKIRDGLRKRYFDGYCFKEETDGVDVSIHYLSTKCFDVICKCFVADIRLFRAGGKDAYYILNGFEGDSYSYKIKNVKLPEMNGFRTIAPVAFIDSRSAPKKHDRYLIGVYRDKLLSNPIIMHDTDSQISESIGSLWDIVVENLYDEAIRIHKKLDLRKMNVLNALSRKEKFNSDVKTSVMKRTEETLIRLGYK